MSGVDTTIVAILAVLAGLATGVIGGYFGRRLILGRRSEAAKSDSSRMLEDAREQTRAILLEAKEEALKSRSAGEAELRERRSELQRTEQRLSSREENLEGRAANLERREKSLPQKGEGCRGAPGPASG